MIKSNYKCILEIPAFFLLYYYMFTALVFYIFVMI